MFNALVGNKPIYCFLISLSSLRTSIPFVNKFTWDAKCILGGIEHLVTSWSLIFDFVDVGISGSGKRVGYKILLEENLVKASVIITDRSKQYPVLGFLLLNCLCRCELIGFEVHHKYHFATNPVRF